MTLALVDSSFFLSLEDGAEHGHAESRQTLDELVSTGCRFLTTNFIFDETYTLIMSRLGRRRAIEWGESFRKGKLVRLFRVSEQNEERAWEILSGWSDKSFSYTDATSFAVGEALGIELALALDDHFKQYGKFEVRP